MTKIQETIQHLIDLKKELVIVKGLECLPGEVKQRCIGYYNNEINEMLDDPYVYDKFYGMLQGGII